MTAEARTFRMLAMPAALAERGFALRPESEADIPFLRQLYISTRWEEFAPIIDWSQEQTIAFLESQFGLQRHHYYTYYPTTDWAVLEQHGTPVGRIYLERQPDAINMLDIALLPEWRGRGIGTALIEAALAEAGATGQVMVIMVEKNNPRAYRLYQRLGFRQTADEGMHFTMVWRPAADVRAAE
jgi:ribosomal protein S18 acetylase RimI-like enzyme